MKVHETKKHEHKFSVINVQTILRNINVKNAISNAKLWDPLGCMFGNVVKTNLYVVCVI